MLLVLLVILLALFGLFSWDRWLRYNDTQDIQGEWIFTSEGNSIPVNINAERIMITSDVKFAYKMDPWAKSIEFNFTDLSGSGFYRFSTDRKTVYIAENTSENIVTSIQVSLGMKEANEGFDPSKTATLTKAKTSVSPTPQTQAPQAGETLRPSPSEGIDPKSASIENYVNDEIP